MIIFLTGHRGFIGQNLKKELENDGHEVIGFEYEDGWKDPVLIPVEKADAVIHLGAISSTTFSDVNQIMKQNYEFSLGLLEQCCLTSTHFQYASSASVYGQLEDSMKEDGPVQPLSPYAWTKYLFDREVEKTIPLSNNTIQGFRYFNVYGDHEDHKGNMSSPVHKFREQAITSKQIKLFKNSYLYERDFVCVKDVCDVHIKMLESNKSGIYNVGTSNPISFEDVANIISEKYTAKIKYIDMPPEIEKQYQKYTCADLTKLNQVIQKEWMTVEEYVNNETHSTQIQK